jgi:peptidyl-prolyl cis-trans isomerase SurA
MRNRLVFPVCLLAASVLYADSKVIETIVARINADIVTLSEYQRRIEELRQQLRQSGLQGLQLQTEMAQRQKDVLRDLIDEVLLLQKGKDAGINVDTEVIRRMDAIRKQMNIPNMEEFEKAVVSQGISFEDYKAGLRNSLIRNQIVGREVGSRIQILPDDVKKFYEENKSKLERPEQVRLAEVLVSTEGKEGEALTAAEKKAADIVARARKNEDFAQLAQKESEGASAANGGDIGMFQKGGLAPELEKVVFALKKGDVTDPLRVKTGFLILKVVEKHAAGIPPLAEIENEIHERLYYERLQPALREFLTKLRDEAYFEIREGYVDSGLPPGAKLSSAHLVPVDVALEDQTTTVAKAKRGGGTKIYKPWTWVGIGR